MHQRNKFYMMKTFYIYIPFGFLDGRGKGQ